MKKQTTFEKLRIKLLNELGIDSCDYSRQYAGKWDKGSGAFLWTARRVIDGKKTSISFGSCHTATDLLKTKNKLQIFGDVFNPEILITNEPK